MVAGDAPGGEPVTLRGSGSDALAFRIVTTPMHGRLEGTAPHLRYVPFDGYVGPDVVTFVVDDGFSVSAPATVSITVLDAKVALLADESMRIGTDTDVEQGGVVVRRADAPSLFVAGYELWIGRRVRILDDVVGVAADSAYVSLDSVVQRLRSNEVTSRGTVVSDGGPLGNIPVGVIPSIVSAGSPRGAAVVVAPGDRVGLGAGSFRSLVIGDGATVVLSGGVYEFDSALVGDDVVVVADQPSEIRVRSGVRIGVGSFVRGGDLGVEHQSTGIVLSVSGSEGVDVGRGSVLSAYVLAPSGTIRFADDVVGIGSFVARRIELGVAVRINPIGCYQLPSVR